MSRVARAQPDAADRASQSLTVGSEMPPTSPFSALLIDVGRGHRRLDSRRSAPRSLKSVDTRHTVLDWTLHALRAAGIHRITYVGGYQIQKVMKRFGDIRYRFVADWMKGRELAGLRDALASESGPVIVIRADTLCVPHAVACMTSEHETGALASYRSGDHSRFAGLVTIPERREAWMSLLDALLTRQESPEIEHWLDALRTADLPIREVDVDTFACPVLDEVAFARTVFGGKGRTLEQLRSLLRSATVLPQFRFTVTEWEADARLTLARARRELTAERVVVRSSAYAEDGLEASGAGRFLSVLDIPFQDDDALIDAIGRVVGSYRGQARVPHPSDEVLLQPYVGELASSGVVFSRDVETGAPYFVITLDRLSGRSDLVTSGGAGRLDTVVVAHQAGVDHFPQDVRKAVALVRELMELTHLAGLDVEFGIDRDGRTYLFQMRPIPRNARRFELADEDLAEELARCQTFLETHLSRHPLLDGKTTMFGMMPDWNPAELVGAAPRPLALTLLQRLIGDRAWSAARAQIGYRDVRPHPLIVSLVGRPYVDVRASLNSFLPADLDSDIATPWVDACIERLLAQPELHDKLEFDVAVTCLAFDFDTLRPRFLAAGLTEGMVERYRCALLGITDAMLTQTAASLPQQLICLTELERRRERWLAGRKPSVEGALRCAAALIEDAERLGAVPFSIAARYAFVAMSLLRSLECAGVFSSEEMQMLVRSIPTVASDFLRDRTRMEKGVLSLDEFLAAYGHLRPSTFDITSHRYGTAWDKYAGPSDGVSSAYPDITVAMSMLDGKSEAIDRLLRAAGFTATPVQFRDFLLNSIPGRERGKFELSRSIDAALELLVEVGAAFELSRDDLSFLPSDALLQLATHSIGAAAHTELLRTVELNRKRWHLTCATRLPHLLTSPRDVDGFQLEEWTPNFVSNRCAVGPPVHLERGWAERDLRGCIVLIQAADPGFDWIFGHNIAGLVTQFGGAGSHMAIRAAEFGLPAAIGCGEILFERLRKAPMIELDCAARRVRALQ